MSDQKTGVPASRTAGIFFRAGALVFLAVLSGVLVYRLFFEDDEKDPTPLWKHEAIHLTQQQEANLPDWGRKIARMISEDLGEDLSQMHDYDAVAGLVLEGIDGKEVRRKLDRSIRSAVTHNAGGFLAQACGYPAHFLRVCTRAGFPAVTLRVHFEDQLFGYLDVLLLPAGDQFKIADLYSYFTGDCRTENFRCTMAPLLIAQKSKGISTWLENWNLKKSDAEYLASLLNARSEGIEEDILTVCDQAPEHLRGNRLVYFARSQALQKLTLTNPRYDQLYFEALRNPPPMPGTPHVLELLLIPKLLAASDYQTADDAMEKVMSVIGDDAYLMCMRAEIKNNLGDPAAAKELLRQAHKLEPELPLLKDLKQELQLKLKNEC